MCKLKMKVISCICLIVGLAIAAKAENLHSKSDNSDKEVLTENSSVKASVKHKRGIFHNEGLGHYATYQQFGQQALWPKAYAAQYNYNFRPVGLSGFRQRPIFAPSYAAQPYVLRPGGATVSSYSATYPRYQFRPSYAVPQPVLPVQPVAPPTLIQSIQPSYAVHPVAAPLPSPPLAVAPPPQQHQYFFQTSAATPLLTATQALPQYPPIAFAPPPQSPPPSFLPSVPQFPAVPQVPQAPPVANIPVVPTSPPANFIFPFSFQPPQPQQPPSFGAAFPVDSGSAVASPQIPASPSPPVAQVPPSPQPEPELPAIQPHGPWRPIYSQPRPPITLQPPYGAPSSGYLPPSQSQSQVQEYQVNENYFDELSDGEIENILQQAKYVPHHSQHLQRQSGLVYQHHY